MKSAFVVVMMLVLVIACGKNKSAEKTDEAAGFTYADTSIMESRMEGDSIVTDSVKTKAGRHFKIKNKTDFTITYYIENFEVLLVDSLEYPSIIVDGVKCLMIKLQSNENMGKPFTIKEGASSQSPYKVKLEVQSFAGNRNTPEIIVDP